MPYPGSKPFIPILTIAFLLPLIATSYSAVTFAGGEVIVFYNTDFGIARIRAFLAAISR